MVESHINYFVINGDAVAEATGFPSVVRLRSTYQSGGSPDLGSGVIVSENVIVTASHVLAQKSDGDQLRELQIEYGNNRHDQGDFDINIRDLWKASVYARHIKLHPDYSRSLGENDIAIVKVDESLFRGAALPAKIAALDPQEPLASSHLAASGWGKALIGGSWLSPIFLQQAGQHISGKPVDILNERGEYYTSGDDSPAQIELLKTALSAKEIYVSDLTGDDARIGPCPGDSGGGLFFGSSRDDVGDPGGDSPAHILLGIVSHATTKPEAGDDPADHYARGDLVVACTNVLGHEEFIKKSIEDLEGEPAEFFG